jgi:peroxiredoxin
MRDFASGTRTPVRAAALLGAAALALTGCAASSSGSSGGSGDNSGYVAGTGEITMVSAAHRVAAPDISGKDLDGQPLSLAQFKGKVVVINVWGSWCAPCRAEADGLEQVATEDAAKGVQFFGINTRDTNVANAQAFVRTHKITYPSLFDEAGDIVGEFPAGSLDPQAIPSTLVIDRQGRIAARALTPLTDDQLRKMIDPVVAEKS